MFLIYVWVKKYVKMCVNVFKMLKSVFEMPYQMGSDFCISFYKIFRIVR